MARLAAVLMCDFARFWCRACLALYADPRLLILSNNNDNKLTVSTLHTSHIVFCVRTDL